MIEILLVLLASLIGWLFVRRQKPTAPPVTPPKKTEPPKYEDKIDATVQAASDPTPDPMPDRDLGRWLDERLGSKRK